MATNEELEARIESLEENLSVAFAEIIALKMGLKRIINTPDSLEDLIK